MTADEFLAMGRAAGRTVVAALLMGSAPLASAWTAFEEAARNLMQGRCEVGVDAANRGLKEGDPTAYYLVGFMLVKGVCVKAAPERAAPYLEAAVKAGQAEAANLLILMHGLGIGVPQSYAQAGRWAIAQMDIMAATNPAAAASRPAGTTINFDEAEQLGVLATVRAALQDELAYPKEAARLHARKVDFNVRLQLDSRGVRYRLSRPNATPEVLRSSVLRASGAPHQEEAVRAIESILEKLPPHPRPAKPFSVDFQLAFNVR